MQHSEQGVELLDAQWQCHNEIHSNCVERDVWRDDRLQIPIGLMAARLRLLAKRAMLDIFPQSGHEVVDINRFHNPGVATVEPRV